jgi:hypothetical protein
MKSAKFVKSWRYAANVLGDLPDNHISTRDWWFVLLRAVDVGPVRVRAVIYPWLFSEELYKSLYQPPPFS